MTVLPLSVPDLNQNIASAGDDAHKTVAVECRNDFHRIHQTQSPGCSGTQINDPAAVLIRPDTLAHQYLDLIERILHRFDDFLILTVHDLKDLPCTEKIKILCQFVPAFCCQIV